MKLGKIDSSLRELAFEEAIGINGGESLWYWVAVGVGGVVKGFKTLSDGAWAGSQDGPNHIFYK